MSGYFEVVGEDEGSGEGFGDEVFCSVIFLFILIYYNNEIPPVVLHSYSENYIFFEYICGKSADLKHPHPHPLRRPVSPLSVMLFINCFLLILSLFLSCL